MIDHLKLQVADVARSRAFYEEALAPLGWRVLMEPAPGVLGFGGDFPFFWIGPGAPTGTAHVAFRAPRRELVDAF